MAKQKKRKTEHLSDAEIWDDSALIRSWDAAAAEYDYYHSIHARGEDVEEVLKQADLAEKINSKASPNPNSNHVGASASASTDAGYEDGEVEDEDLEELTVPAEKGHGSAHESYNAATVPSATDGNAYLNGHQSNASIKGSNQVLENIKMAYWWAGYYSGLYESQQATAATPTKEQQPT